MRLRIYAIFALPMSFAIHEYRCMNSYTIDTSDEAHRRHVENVRAMSPAERVAAAFNLSAWAMERALTVIREQYPSIDEQEARLILLGRLYGNELADRVRCWRKAREVNER
jgi:hypothetical protein